MSRLDEIKARLDVRSTCECSEQITYCGSYPCQCDPVCRCPNRINAALIVNARADLSWLIAEMTRVWQMYDEHLNGPYSDLQKECHELRRQLEIATQALENLQASHCRIMCEPVNSTSQDGHTTACLTAKEALAKIRGKE